MGAPRHRWARLKRGLAILTALGLLAALSAPSCARRLPGLLVVADAPARADALVVLAGDHRATRIEAAVRLWDQGLVADGPFVVAGGQLYGALSWADVMRARALELGVPAERILREGSSRTTSEDARECARLLDPQPGQRILLVTSEWHSGRALEHFRRELAPAEVLSCPAPQGYPDEWWEDPEATRALAAELLKRLWPGPGG